MAQKRVRLNKIYAHPEYGIGMPGEIMTLPSKEAAALIKSGQAVGGVKASEKR